MTQVIDLFKNFFTSENTVIEKKNLIKIWINNIDTINNFILPMFTELEKVDLNKNTLIKNIRIGGKSLPGNQVITVMEKIFKDITEDKDIINLIDKVSGSLLSDRTLNTKQLNLVKIVLDVTHMANYTFDLFYLILKYDELRRDKTATLYSDKKIKEIYDLVDEFGTLLFLYKDFNEVVKSISTIEERILDIDNKELFSFFALKNKITSNYLTGFINNPIYHFRMWLVDKQFSRYESLKDKKRLIELIVLDLKIEKEDDSIRKQIDYYEEKINKIEIKLRKHEEL